MNWLFLTILAILSRATYSIATKILSKDVQVTAITHSLLLTCFAGVISFFISPFVGGISFYGIEKFFLPTILMIVSQAFGNVLFFIGIKKLDAGTTQIAFSSILIWGAILSVLFLGSVFSLVQIVGIIFMLIAILMIQYKKGKLEMNSGFLYIVCSAILFAIFQVASAGLSKTLSTGTYLILAYGGPSIIIGLLYFRKIKNDFILLQKQIKNTFIKTIYASGTSMLYFLFSYLAYRYAPDRGIVVVLLTSQVILSVLFGVLFLKEKDNTTKKFAAGILAFIAGVLIKS